MNVIPPDESRGDRPTDGRDTPDERSFIDRLRGGLKSVLLAFPGVSAVLSTRSTDRSESVKPANEPDADSGSEAPTPLPGGQQSELEVVSDESDDTLTVEAADNPDATITSDTWEAVER